MSGSVRLIDLLVAGVKAARQARGWSQEDAAQAFQSCGLKAWRRCTVGQMEAKLRFPQIGELLLMCAALDVPLADLIAAADGDVQVYPGATMPGSAIRALLSGTQAGVAPLLPAKPVRPTGAEGDAACKLGVRAAVVAATSRSLWDRSLDEERDARAGDLSSLSPRSRQARRGLAARPLIAELEKALRAEGIIGA